MEQTCKNIEKTENLYKAKLWIKIPFFVSQLKGCVKFYMNDQRNFGSTSPDLTDVAVISYCARDVASWHQP